MLEDVSSIGSTGSVIDSSVISGTGSILANTEKTGELPPLFPNVSDGSTQVLLRGRKPKRIPTHETFNGEATESDDPDVAEPPESVAIEPQKNRENRLQAMTAAAEALESHFDLPVAPLEDSTGESLPEAVTTPQGKPSSTTANQPKKEVVAPRRSMWLAVLTLYSLLATAAVAYLLYRIWLLPSTSLESLPDLPPLKEKSVSHYPKSIGVPVGHTLQLKETRRFGNIEIEPLEIVRGKIGFEPLTVRANGRPARQRLDEGPLLQLRLRLKNLSQDQQIAPLDPWLVFGRVTAKSGETVANQFVFRPDQRSDKETPLLLYAQPVVDDWKLKSQNLGQVLSPGESFETFLPAAAFGENELLAGHELLWRVHLRKGYSPKGYGVTTVIEVAFRPSDIRDES